MRLLLVMIINDSDNDTDTCNSNDHDNCSDGCDNDDDGGHDAEDDEEDDPHQHITLATIAKREQTLVIGLSNFEPHSEPLLVREVFGSNDILQVQNLGNGALAGM